MNEPQFEITHPVMPEKIPDHILLKESRKEVGQLKSYIDELEHANKQLTKELESLLKMEPSERNGLKKERAYTQKNDEMRTLQQKHRKLKSDYELLLNKYYTSKNQ